jgi:hypothetical protein
VTEHGLERIELDGVRFVAPPGWSREVEHSEDGVVCSMQSTGVSFALVGIYPSDRDPDDVVEQALDSLRQEHPTLEADEWDEADPDDPIQTIEAVFFSLDIVSYCWLRAWRVGERTVLAMVQSVEPESERGRLVFRAICQSTEPAGELPSEESTHESAQAPSGPANGKRTKSKGRA